jgi:predicted deacetylase
MAIDDTAAVTVRATGVPPPALLVSLHDVSPLTVEDCRRAVEMLRGLGVGAADLTLFVIPHHEGVTTIDADAPTVGFLRGLADDGACLAMHGLTHRMPGRAWSPGGIIRAHVFARGTGELYKSDEQDTLRRLERGAALLRKAGLEDATRAFVPPAWQLSPAARAVIERISFDFYERFGGIVHGDRLRARRLIGWGSLNAVEAAATAIWASAQSRRSPADTRLAIHPADMRRPAQARAVRRALQRLLPRMRAMSYRAYLTSPASGARSQGLPSP